MRARDIMAFPVITVAPDLPIHDAADLLARRGFTALPVVDQDDRLIGLVTEADLIRERIAVDPRIHSYTEPTARSRRIPVVADVMTTSVESFTPGAAVADVAAAMIAERVRCFPIVDGRRLVGVITRRDLLTAAVSHIDADLQREVLDQLSAVGGRERWRVNVQAAVAMILDSQHTAPDRERTRAIVLAVNGIVDAQVHHPKCDPF